MKRIVLFSMLALLGMTQMVAQEYEYVPFVREGVKWVYVCDNPYLDDVLDMPFGLHYYSFEMKGDVLIGDKYYKPVVLTHYLDKTGQNMEVEIFTPVYLREEEKVVYAIHPDGIWYAQCPVGYCWYVEAPYSGGLPLTATKEEFILYDFNDPVAYWDRLVNQSGYDDQYQHCYTDTIALGTHLAKQYVGSLCGGDFRIIEGVGIDAFSSYTLDFFLVLPTGYGTHYQVTRLISS